jgi:hypothetical protein
MRPVGSVAGLMQSVAPSSEAILNFAGFMSMANIRFALRAAAAYSKKYIFFRIISDEQKGMI